MMKYKAVKRLMDIIVASAVLLLTLPIMLVVAAIMLITSPGPVFFGHTRLGLRGRTFKMYKFRTMVPNAHKMGPAVTQKRDPRITPLGRILRKTKLDELPQLWNVIKGDMSLVGPRPQVQEYVDLYPEIAKHIILSVRPGVTGRTQVWLRHEEELLAAQRDPLEYYKYTLLPRKVESDVFYVNDISLTNDIKILFRTALCCMQLTPKTENAPAEEPIHTTVEVEAA